MRPSQGCEAFVVKFQFVDEATEAGNNKLVTSLITILRTYSSQKKGFG